MKNRFKDDYRETARLDSRGRAVRGYDYVGRIYVLPFDGKKKWRTVWITLLYALGLTAVQVAAGLLNPDSSHTFWIVYPYLFIYLPLFYAFFGVYAYAEATTRMQSVQYEHGLVRIRRSFVAVMVLAALNVVLDVAYMIVHRGEIRLGVELAYCLMFVLLIVGVICYGRFYDRNFGGIVVEE